MFKLYGGKGYLAITSAIIISIILMVLVFTVSYSGYLNRFNILDTASKEVSRSAAEACVAEARLKIIQDILYAGDEIIIVGENQCAILPIETNILQKTIKTKASVRMAVTNLKVAVVISDFTVASWEELANF